MDPYQRAQRTQTRLGICLLLFGGLIQAQGVGQFNPDIPSCGSPWSLVSRDGRNPCQMLFAVMNPCAMQDNGLPFSLSNVSSQPLGMYAAPLSEVTTLDRCQCTEAGYNLYSACTACQVGNIETHWLSRSDWFTGCASVRSSGQVQAAPPSTVADELDEWITHPYDPKFSVAEALNVANNVSVVSAGSASPTTVTLPASTNGSTASESVQSSPNAMTSAGAIAGVVCGIIALLAIIFIVVWVCYRRRKAQRTAPSAEFMKYSNTREPLRSHSRANTGDEEGLMMPLGPHSYGPHRGSVVRSDSPDINNNNHYGGGDIEMSEGGPNGAPPAFTPGLFKDPIFEKGVALNLAAAAAASNSGHAGGASGGLGAGPGGPYGGSPVTYSPATPSTAHAGMERQGLIQSRQGTE